MSNITYLVTMNQGNQKVDRPQRIIMLKVYKREDLPSDFGLNYHTHLLCHRGRVDFKFNDLNQSCKGGEFLFWFARSNLADLQFSKRFNATVLLVENHFLNSNIPDQNWGIDAALHSRQYPVKALNDKKDRKRILTNFQLLNAKFQDKGHHFYEEALKLQMRLFIFEMWHTFVNEYERRKRSLQTGTLYERFRQLIEDNCMTEREVQFYANQLNITAKYLNAISKQNSGVTASEWIQRFTRERIVRMLQNEKLNIAEISDEMGFSSRSFFTRYVKKILGFTPTEYRNRLG
ncbi:helix-turn-helix transcriptional regulator [Algoriphagus aestuariicola]|uniref:Helix-turn-helix transcriptional regulator n=1 Tax=Algoriphagus aestuariicola TaxID=1852016 RepID=A0ABS3BMY1_9BACT|nr:AraC family transcriptional regulator [Algoriphagus aestuariicola]MBN7800251.1 helix-turn-helix transcriptional regulator [Algoriphagus aestuariicola]